MFSFDSILAYFTFQRILSIAIHIAGFVFLYVNRKELLYDNEDGNPDTPNILSLARVWAWVIFYFACSYWVGYTTGSIPPTTPFPPVLEDMLFTCLAYEFFKKGWDIGRAWIRMRGACDNVGRNKKKKCDNEDADGNY